MFHDLLGGFAIVVTNAAQDISYGCCVFILNLFVQAHSWSNERMNKLCFWYWSAIWSA